MQSAASSQPDPSFSEPIFDQDSAVIVSLFARQRLSETEINRLSPTALAYVGDAVYELHFRTCYLSPPQRMASYHHRVVEKVRAESQAEDLQKILPYLTDQEQDWLRRGRNAAKGCPRRLSPQVYQQASGLETLIGYLYIVNPPRLAELFTYL